MEYRLLGPLEVLSHGEPLKLGGPQQRAVLAILLLHPNQVVATDTMIDEIWGERPPQAVGAIIQNCIHRLRRTLGPDVIERRAPGYLLRVDPTEIDAYRFERALDAAAGIGHAERVAALREALALWHGAPLADFTYQAFASAEIARLDELRLLALEQRLEAELALGRHEAVLGQIEALVRRHPSRERLRELQMLALYRAGRQRDALRAYQEARLELLEEHGLEPGEALRDLERMVISHDPALRLQGVADAVAPTESTRGAVVLLLELAAGANVPRELVASFLAEAALAVERHEGTLRDLDADRAVAVFGTPVTHDDDTLRALRVAHEIRAAAPHAIDVRVAIERGDDADMASDLIASAPAGEVVLGAGALQLVSAAVDVVPQEAGHGYRVLRFDPSAEPIARHFDAPLVGRGAELAQLESAIDGLSAAHRIVLVGDAGIGKTRLVRELVARVERGATVLAGRCAPYGDAAALRPLHQILDQLGPLDTVLAGEDDAEVVAARLRDRSFADRSEAFWALRRVLERVATQRPLVVVLEDVHWAAPVLLDLVEYLEGWAVAPILLLCVTRPELLDARPEWRDDAIFLAPLPREDAEALVAALPNAPAEPAAAVDAGEGNPLFLEQLVAFAAEDGGSLPPTLDVLIRSRVDRLPDAERDVLERAAVVGRHFWRSTVEASFGDERPGVGGALMALVRRRFVRPEQATALGEDGFRFQHVLIRDSVYGGIEEAARAHSHEAVARAIDRRGGDVDEIVGYHLEQAARVDPGLEPEAGQRLGAAGVRAMRYIDARPAIDLLTRAIPLVTDPGARLELECALGTAAKFAGDLARANPILDGVAERAAAASDVRIESLARVEQLWSKLGAGELTPDAAFDVLRRARDAFAGDDFALARTLHLEAAVVGVYCFRYSEAEALAESALDHYRRAGAAALGSLTVIAVSAWRGPRPVEDAIERCRSALMEIEAPGWRSFVLPPLASLEAMRGKLDVARSHLEEARRGRSEFSDTGTIVSSWSAFAADVELRVGDPARAEHILRDACETLRAVGEREWLATNGAMLAEALYRQEQFAEALAEADAALATAPTGHLTSLTVGGRVRAVSLAALDRHDEARAAVDETLARLEHADVLDELGAVHAAAGRVHRLAGSTVEADRHWRRALAYFEQKGNVVSAERVRDEVAAV